MYNVEFRLGNVAFGNTKTIVIYCFLVEFPVGYAHLEDRACPELRKHSGCQTGRANSSHCSSFGIFNKRGKFSKSKTPPNAGVLIYNKKISFGATVNYIICQWFLSSDADTFSMAASWNLW